MLEKSECVSTEVGSFEVLDLLVSRPTERLDRIKRIENWGEEVSLQEFQSFFDDHGVMQQHRRFQERVFYGGLSPEAQPKVPSPKP